MSLSQLKNVKWSDDERVDLDDLNAVAALKDTDLRELLLAFMEPPVNGRVYAGFTGAAGVGLTFDFAGLDSLAVAADGSMLEMPAATPLSAALPASASVYIHGYLVEQDSDLDNRRFLNDIPVPPEEVTVNTRTRQTKVVGLHVTSNADAVLQLGSFQSSAFISGKTRRLVALYAMKTSGSGVIGGSVVDFRQMWMVNGNQIPAVNGGVSELPFTVGGSNGDRNVKGLRSMFQAIASVLRTLAGDPAVRDWWDTAYVRTDPLNTSTKSSLRDRIVSSRGEFCTVHPTADRADFATLTAALAATSSGEIRMKAATHLIPINTALTGKQNITISGEGQGSTLLKINDGSFSSNPGFVLGANTKGITFKDLSVLSVNDGSSSNGPLFDFTATTTEDITFINCHLTSAVYAHLRGVVGSAKNLKFINCRIDLDFDGLFDTSVAAGWNPANDTIFEGCQLNPLSSFGGIVGSTQQQLGGVTRTRWNNCQFGDRTLTFTWAGWRSLQFQASGSALTWEAHFNNCEFWGLESFCEASAQIKFFMAEFTFERCRFKVATVLPTTALFNHTATSITWDSNARITWYDCEVFHSQMFYSGFAGNHWPSLFAFNTRFVTTNPGAAGAAGSLFYNQSGNSFHNTMRFVNCQFWHRTASAFFWDIDVAGNSHNAWFFQGCEFYASHVPGGQLLSSGIEQIMLRHFGPGPGGIEVFIRDCLFQNGHVSQRPLRLEVTAAAGKGSASLEYTWQNGTDGNPADTGSSHLGWRVQETAFRMLKSDRRPL